MEYLYRVVYRTREEYWDLKEDPAKNVWMVWQSYTAKNRPYTTARPAKAAVTRNNRDYKKLEFRAQRLPATDWKFI